MKKLLIATMIFVLPLLSQSVFGQRGELSPNDRAQRQTAMMQEALNLTEEQLPKVEEINLKYAQKGADLREEHQGSRETMMTAFREVRKQQEEELSVVLTEEQMALLKEKQEEMRNQRRKGRRGRKK